MELLVPPSAVVRTASQPIETAAILDGALARPLLVGPVTANA